MGTNVLATAEHFRQLASAAHVATCYRIWRDPFLGAAEFETTHSFARACEMLREGTQSSMQILFRWRLGDKRGEGDVSYLRMAFPTATDRFVERTTQNQITAAIAESLAAGRFTRVPSKAATRPVGSASL
jgi:hypothetical protein